MKTLKYRMIFWAAISAMLLNACIHGYYFPEEMDNLSVFVEELEFEAGGETQFVEVSTNAKSWTAGTKDTWIKINLEENKFSVKVDNHSDAKQDRIGIITVKAGEATPATITVTQLATAFYVDREVVKLQSASAGKGVNIVLMGDGYTANDMRKRSGKYEQDMREAVDHFFSVQPFIRYRDHFNVYMVAAISNREGVSVKATGKNVDTKFSAIWDGGNSTKLDCNKELVFKYVDAISELSETHYHDLTIILPINADIYAGTCWMYYPDNYTGNGTGASIALCPVSRNYKGKIEGDFRSIVLHEAAGHGFAKLADEYIVYSTTIPLTEKNLAVTQKTAYDWWENVDFYSNIKNTSWSGFAGKAKYHMTSVYEGADYYAKGIWRAEQNSCMNDNVAYFNAPSRWAQVKRIKKLAWMNYSFEQFLQEDVVPEYPKGTQTKNMEDFVPLASPVFVQNLPEKLKVEN